MKIPKLQTASQKLTLLNDNTRVAVTPSYLNNYRLVKLRQQYLKEKAKEAEDNAIRDYVQNRDSQTITADNRTTQQREQGYKRLEQVRQQQHQQQQKQQNAEAFGHLVAGATAPLNYLSVAQHYRAAKETDNWRDYLNSIRKGNSGFVSEEFHQSAPILSTLINLGGDVATGAGTLKGLSLLGRGVKLATPTVSLARNSNGQWNGWINVGSRQYRPNITSLGMNKLVESRSIVNQQKLPLNLAQKGWTLADDGALISPQGKRFIRNSTGQLQSEESIKITKDTQKNIELNKKQLSLQKNRWKIFDEDTASKFKEESGLDFSLSNWERLAKGHIMTDQEKKIYTQEAYPKFVETYRYLRDNNKLIRENGKWKAWFDEPVGDVSDKLPLLKEKWNRGFRELNDEEAMMYIITNSPQGKDKFVFNGVTMYGGIPQKYKQGFELGENNQAFPKWFDSNIAGASTYSNPAKLKKDPGLQIYGLPIKPSKLYKYMSDKVRLIRRQTAHPSSNSWNGQPQSPIASFIEKNPEKKIHMSEGPLKDDLASAYNGTDINGVFTIVGENIPVKSAFGGTGMYDIKGKNLFRPFAQYTVPIGISTTLGYKYFNNEK